MIILIDNYDSFTYNLFQQISNLGQKVEVHKNDQISISEIEKKTPAKIIISPGPKDPNHSGISIPVIKKFYKEVPILGVCLGHQCIGQLFGAKIVSAKQIMHGKTSQIKHNNKAIFKNIENPMTVARYHSLAIDKVPTDFQLLAHTKDQEIMAIKHNKYPLFGIQFHPESFLTESGEQLMNNFLNEN